jgi:Protein of unknown function (DUF1761)
MRTLMPDIQPNFIAILIAAVVNFFFGYLWFTPLFGKRWSKEMGMSTDYKPSGAEMGKSLAINLLGMFLLAMVLSSNIAAWTPSTWGSSLPGLPWMMQAFQAAFFTWLGFMVPMLLNGVAWERKSWTLTAINGGYYFFCLLFAAMIIIKMR